MQKPSNTDVMIPCPNLSKSHIFVEICSPTPRSFINFSGPMQGTAGDAAAPGLVHGLLIYDDLTWSAGTETRTGTQYEETALPLSRVLDFMRGEQAMGTTRFLKDKTVWPTAGGAPRTEQSKRKKRLFTEMYHCHFGPDDKSPKETADPTVIKKEASAGSSKGTRRSKVLEGRSLKVGCLCRFSIYQTVYQAELDPPMATIRCRVNQSPLLIVDD